MNAPPSVRARRDSPPLPPAVHLPDDRPLYDEDEVPLETVVVRAPAHGRTVVAGLGVLIAAMSGVITWQAIVMATDWREQAGAATDELAAYLDDNGDLLDTIDQLRAETSSFEDRVVAHEREVALLEELRADAEASSEAARSRVTDVEAESDELTAMLDAYDGGFANLETCVDRYVALVDTLMSPTSGDFDTDTYQREVEDYCSQVRGDVADVLSRP